jgi:hypothetical protein
VQCFEDAQAEASHVFCRYRNVVYRDSDVALVSILPLPEFAAKPRGAVGSTATTFVWIFVQAMKPVRASLDIIIKTF